MAALCCSDLACSARVLERRLLLNSYKPRLLCLHGLHHSLFNTRSDPTQSAYGSSQQSLILRWSLAVGLEVGVLAGCF